MTDTINPNAPDFYGVPTNPGGNGGVPVIQGRSGALHLPGGGSPFAQSSGRGGSRAGRGYGENQLPPLDDYFKSRALQEKVPSVSSAPDETLAGWANDYAQHFIPGALEGTYQRKVDKNEIDSHVARFNMQFANRLPEFKAYLAKQENAGALPKAGAAPSDLSTTASAETKNLLGNTDIGLANVAKDSPSILSQLSNPLVNPTAIAPKLAELGLKASRGEKISLSDFYSPVVKAESIAPTVNVLAKPAEKYLREGGEQNVEGGGQQSKEENLALAQHPVLTGATTFGGQALPIVAGSALGPGGTAVVSAAQSGGGARQAQEERINALDESHLKAIPEYQHLLQTTGDSKKAKALLAQAAGEAAGDASELFGGITGTFGGGALTKPVQGLITKLVGQSALKRVLASAGIEAAGLTASGAAQQVAETAQTNKATGEKREADVGAGAPSNALLGLFFGGLGALAHKPLANGKTPAPETKPGETPPPAAGAAPVGDDAYAQAYQGVVENPEHQVKPGTPLEEATPTLIEALDQFNARYGALHEAATPEQREAAGAKFEDDWKKQFNVQEPKPQVAESPAKPVNDAEAAQAVSGNPAETFTEASEPPKEPIITPPEASAPDAAVEAPTLPGEARETLEQPGAPPGEARENAPAPVEVPPRELATMPGVDPRLPLGVTERVAGELRESLGRDPTAKEINDHAGLVLDEAMRQKGVDSLIPALARREAIGQLLEEKPTEIPEPEAINKRARKLQIEGLDKVIADRSKEFEKHPAVVARKNAEEFRNALKRARSLPDNEAAAKNHAEIERVQKEREAKVKAEQDRVKAEQDAAQKAEQDRIAKEKSDVEFRRVLAKARSMRTAEEKAKLADEINKLADEEKARQAKAKSDEDFRNVLKKTRALGEKSNEEFRNVLKKARALPPPKTEAVSQEGDAAHSRTKDSFGHRVTGRSVDELRQTLEEKWGKKAVFDLEKTGVLKLVQSMKDLEALEPGSVDPKYVTAGYYNGKRGYLVADHIPRGEEVGTLLHEVGTHYGLKRMLPSDLFGELRQYVRDNIDVDPELTQAYQKAVEGNPNPRLVEEETIAQMVQAKAEVPGSIWHRAWTAVKAFVYRTLGKYLPTQARQKLLTNDVIRSLVRAATRAQGKHAYLDVNDSAYSRTPSNFKTVEEVQQAWHQTTPPDKEQTAQAKESRMQAWATKNVNELKPLQYLNRALEKLGVKVTPDKDIFASTTLLPSRAQFEVDHDQANYIEPFLNTLTPIINRLGFGKSPKEFLGHLNDAIAGRHALERNKLLYYQTVRLNDAGEQARAPILLDIFNGKLKPEEYLPKLKAIVNKPGAIIEKSGKRMGSGLSDEMAYKLIESAKKAGITDSVAEEINQALDPIRQRTLENGARSKRYTPEQRNIQKAYQFKWYLPFKGFAEDTPNGVDGSRRPLGAFNKDTSYMEGRQTQSRNPLENLLADLTASSRDVAYNETAQTIFKAANDKTINNKLGTKIKAYDVNRLTQDSLAGGGKLADIESIFRSPNTVIYNNGTHRFSIEFPEGSKELTAIKSVQKENTLDGLTKSVGRLTNLFARAKTAYSPVFDLFTALVRDTSTYPLMAGIEKGPKVVANYAGNLVKFGGPLGAWRTYVGALRGKSFGEIEQRAQANPDSFAGWAYRLSKSGGGLDFRQELNNVSKVDDIAAKLGQANKLTNPKEIGKGFLNFLDAFATSSIATGRVSMFKALVESGMSDAEAGLYTKRLLNFQQTSEGSRRMNAYFAFWRAGIANADRLHELVHNPDGSFNRARFGKIVVGGIAAAAAWNGVLKAYYGDDAKKLTQDTLSKNFVLPIEYNGEPIKLPMGLGLPRLMLGLGMLATRYSEGDSSLKDTLEATKNTLFENLSPLKPSQSKDNATAGERAMDLMSAAFPSVARPFWELERNQTIFGRDIHTSYPKENEFRSAQGERATPNEWKELAKELQSTTGVDVYPESIEYLANSLGAGFMTEGLRAFVLENKEAQGKETSVSDYPFVPRFTTGDIKYASSREFYGHRDDLKDSTKEVNTLKAENKPIPAALQKKADEEKKLENAAREHSKAIKEIESNKLLSGTARAQRLAQLNAQYQRVQEQLSREVERMR